MPAHITFAPGASPDKRSYRVCFASARLFTPRWSVQKGHERDHRAYTAQAAQRSSKFLSPRFQRIGRLLELVEAGELDAESAPARARMSSRDTPLEQIPVMILSGGLGTRLREESERVPKPLVDIGERPILWHIMKLFGHFGFNRFVLCLGYKSWEIKEYFLRYREHLADFTVRLGDPDRP